MRATLETVVCDLCGSSDFQPLYTMADQLGLDREEFTIVKCGGCGLVFVNPRPEEEEEIGKELKDFVDNDGMTAEGHFWIL